MRYFNIIEMNDSGIIGNHLVISEDEQKAKELFSKIAAETTSLWNTIDDSLKENLIDFGIIHEGDYHICFSEATIEE